MGACGHHRESLRTNVLVRQRDGKKERMGCWLSQNPSVRALSALLYVGQPEQGELPPVPLQRPSPGQVSLKGWVELVSWFCGEDSRAGEAAGVRSDGGVGHVPSFEEESLHDYCEYRRVRLLIEYMRTDERQGHDFAETMRYGEERVERAEANHPCDTSIA